MRISVLAAQQKRASLSIVNPSSVSAAPSVVPVGSANRTLAFTQVLVQDRTIADHVNPDTVPYTVRMYVSRKPHVPFMTGCLSMELSASIRGPSVVFVHVSSEARTYMLRITSEGLDDWYLTAERPYLDSRMHRARFGAHPTPLCRADLAAG